MNLDEVKKYIDASVLCWMATSSIDNQPNVSPKEVFSFYGENSIIIANIASPKSAKNIEQNARVSLSFIDVFVQKGCKVTGLGRVISTEDKAFDKMKICLEKITQGKYPFQTIFEIQILKVDPIVAPSYFFYPDVSDDERIENAKQGYGVDQE